MLWARLLKSQRFLGTAIFCLVPKAWPSKQEYLQRLLTRIVLAPKVSQRNLHRRVSFNALHVNHSCDSMIEGGQSSTSLSCTSGIFHSRCLHEIFAYDLSQNVTSVIALYLISDLPRGIVWDCFGTGMWYPSRCPMPVALQLSQSEHPRSSHFMCEYGCSSFPELPSAICRNYSDIHFQNYSRSNF